LIFAHSEKVIFLRDFCYLAEAIGTLPLRKILFGPEPFAGDTVPPLVAVLIDLASIVKILKDLLNNLLVADLCGADEVVVGDIEPLPEGLEPFDHFIAVGLRIDSPFLCGLLHFLTMFIRAGEKEGLITFESLKAGEDVGRNGRIGMADMGNIVDIVDGSGDVESAFRFRMHGS
jgi:hypothetical protein